MMYILSPDSAECWLSLRSETKVPHSAQPAHKKRCQSHWRVSLRLPVDIKTSTTEWTRQGCVSCTRVPYFRLSTLPQMPTWTRNIIACGCPISQHLAQGPSPGLRGLYWEQLPLSLKFLYTAGSAAGVWWPGYLQISSCPKCNWNPRRRVRSLSRGETHDAVHGSFINFNEAHECWDTLIFLVPAWWQHQTISCLMSFLWWKDVFYDG